jgi:hypothetical protein
MPILVTVGNTGALDGSTAIADGAAPTPAADTGSFSKGTLRLSALQNRHLRLLHRRPRLARCRFPSPSATVRFQLFRIELIIDHRRIDDILFLSILWGSLHEIARNAKCRWLRGRPSNVAGCRGSLDRRMNSSLRPLTAIH